MSNAYLRTNILIIFNTLFLLINICLFSYINNTKKDNILSKKYIKEDRFKQEIDQYIVYGKENPDETIQIQYEGIVEHVNPLYSVPDIEYTSLVNCEALLSGSLTESQRAIQIMNQRPKVPLLEEMFLEWTKDCPNFKNKRGYVTRPLSVEEAHFPLAFSIAIYKDVEQVERLLRAIYQPQNIYCIHIDIKSSVLLHRTLHRLANCFHNVFIASNLDKIKWGDVSVLYPDLNCMSDLVNYYYGKWKYYINLTGQEMPLRSNYELVKIAKIFNGSNDIAGSVSRMDPDRVKYKWAHRWSKTYDQTIFYNTYEPKEPPLYNLTFYKGEVHGLFSQNMVEYIIKSKVAKDYLHWCWNSGHPSEHYWNVLNYNSHLEAPGGYIGNQEVADVYAPEPIVRAKHWIGLYDGRQCHGKIVRGICVYGVGDLQWLNKRPELFANKFHLNFHYLAYDCMEERHRNRTKLKDKIKINDAFYKSLPTVKFSRKNGLVR